MVRMAFVVAGIILMTAPGIARAAEPRMVLAEGAWSKAVADEDGDAVRGRLVLVERPVTVGGRAHFPRQQRRGVDVYLELQDARETAGESMRIFCDLGRTDVRPEYKGGLHCAMFDKDKEPVPPTPAAFSGGAPRSQWVTLPADATVRLRASPFGIHRENAFAVSVTPTTAWVIQDNDTKEYFLSGTFTAGKDADGGDKRGGGAERVWQGTLDLPAVRVASPAAPDPIVGLVAKLTATHGLWLNGVYPKLDVPAGAPVERVLPEVFEKTSPPQGKVTTFYIIERREVTIPIVADRKMAPQEQYTAVRVKTNVGHKIVLMQQSRTDWWSRIYDEDQ